ncbi:MAG: DUF434 domain-containing protein [Saprospiraceae bacterium]
MTQRNRGKTSSDDQYFAPKWYPIFTQAVDDFCYLLSRNYAAPSVLAIVGNHYRLNKRQRNAISRIVASDQAVLQRQANSCETSILKNQVVAIDGFNLLIWLESALSGAYIFKGRDGVYRDISSVHGSYKRVRQTESAIHLVGKTLQALGIKSAQWYFDKPVSNSGKLKARLLEISQAEGFNWEATLVFNPDQVLAQSEAIVISSDGWILDQCKCWFNLNAYLLEERLLEAQVIVV